MKFQTAQIMVVTLLLSPVSEVFSQAPAIEWQNTIGGTSSDILTTIQQTEDGGYIVGGTSESGISGDKAESKKGFSDYWVLKLDSAGSIEWQNTIGGIITEDLTSIHQTADGGYILGGSSSSNISGDKSENNKGPTNTFDYWVVKLTSTGAIQWDKTIGGSADDDLSMVRQTADGGYILGGTSTSPISGDKSESNHSGDYWVVKLSSTGALQWQNTIWANYGESFKSVEQTSDGGYIIGGESYSEIGGDKTEVCKGGQDYWVLKLNSFGAIEWQKTIGGNSYDNFATIEEVPTGGYIIGGFSTSDASGDKSEGNSDYDYWVVKLDASGNIEWENTIGGSGFEYLRSLKSTADGGFIIGGNSTSGISNDKTEASAGEEDYWVVKLNSSGTIEWQNSIGGTNSDNLDVAQQTTDGGFILGGFSDSEISGDKTEAAFNSGRDYWVIKLDPYVCSGLTVYADFDHDGFGDPTNNFVAADCIIPNGYIATDHSDCDDFQASVNPSMDDVCANLIDDNCNGQIDESPPPAPGDLNAINITTTSAKLTWDPTLGTFKYKIHYKVKNTPGWTLVKTVNTSKNISDLSQGTEYAWKVKSLCATNPISNSGWSYTSYFTTDQLKTTTSEVGNNSLELYPNPASESTTVHFYLAQPSEVTMNLFDVNGKEALLIPDQSFDAGDHRVALQLNDLTKGIYFLRLISEGDIRSEKLILE